MPIVKRPDISRTHHRSLLYPDLVSRLGFREPLDPEVCQVDGDVGGYQLVSEVLQDANRLFKNSKFKATSEFFAAKTFLVEKNCGRIFFRFEFGAKFKKK